MLCNVESKPSLNFWRIIHWTSVCDGTQNFKQYRYRYFFPVPISFDTDTDTSTNYKSSKFLNFGGENQFQYQIFPISVPRFFSGTNFLPILVPIPTKKWTIPSTGSSHSVPWKLMIVGLFISFCQINCKCSQVSLLIVNSQWFTRI